MNQATCACLRVNFDPTPCEEGGVYERWSCPLCGRGFLPMKPILAERDEAMRQRGILAAALSKVEDIYWGLMEGATINETIDAYGTLLCDAADRTDLTKPAWWDKAAKEVRESWMPRALAAEAKVRRPQEAIEAVEGRP